MKRLALLPLLMFAFACGDGSLVQPEQEQGPEILAHQGHGRGTEYTFQFTGAEELSGLPPAPTATPDGDLVHFVSTNGNVVEGELEGYAYFTGGATLDQNTGLAEGTGPMLLVLTEPGVGSFACTWSANWEDFFAVVHGRWHACKGYGYFEGMKLYSTNNNETSDPGVTDAVALIK